MSPPAADALRWVVQASQRLPVPDEEQAGRLSETFLAGIGGTGAFNDALVALGPLTLDSPVAQSPVRAEATIRYAGGLLTTVVQLDGAGRVAGLRFLPHQPDPRSWPELDAQLRRLAPWTSYASAVIGPDGRCRLVHGVDERVRRPLGSAFKLYVLGALARAVEQGRVAWDEPLAVRDDWKSLPSGRLQDAPAGTVLPLRRYAELMIAISDNTATDHLIHRLGRAAVQAQFVRFSHRRPAVNGPLLTTRELFVLKGARYPALADEWLSLPRRLRATALPALGQVPTARVRSWSAPRHIDTIEWYASPADICHAFAGLARQGADPRLAAVDAALSGPDGGLRLDRSRFPAVWYKGGSEPGVLTLNHLVRTAAGATVLSSVMVADPGQALDEPAVQVRATAIARAGVRLAAGE